MILNYIKSENMNSPLNFIVIFVNSPVVVGMVKPTPCLTFNSCMLPLNYHGIVETHNGLF